jgi:U3 small nucleolar RNA-associated protein 22
MFKAMLQFLASRDLIGSPLLFDAEKEALGDLKGPIILDGEMGLNLLFKMTEWGYKLVGFIDIRWKKSEANYMR